MIIDPEMPVPFLLVWHSTKPPGVRELAVEELIRRDLNPSEVDIRSGTSAATLFWAAHKYDQAERWARALLERDLTLAQGLDHMQMMVALCCQARGASADECFDFASSILEQAVTLIGKTYEDPSHALKLLSEPKALPEVVVTMFSPMGNLFHLAGELPLAMRCYQLEAMCNPGNELPHKKILSIMLTESKYLENPMLNPPLVMQAAELTEQRHLNEIELKLYTLTAFMNNEHYEEVIEACNRVESLAKELVDKSDPNKNDDVALSLQLLDGFFDFYRLNAAIALDDAESYSELIEEYRQMAVKPSDLVGLRTFSPIGILERARFMAHHDVDRENEVLEAVIYHCDHTMVQLHNLSLYAHYAMFEAQDQAVALRVLEAVLKHAPGHVIFLEFLESRSKL